MIFKREIIPNVKKSCNNNILNTYNTPLPLNQTNFENKTNGPELCYMHCIYNCLCVCEFMNYEVDEMDFCDARMIVCAHPANGG